MAKMIERAIEINNSIVNYNLDPETKEMLINEFRTIETYVTTHGSYDDICKFYGV